MIEVPRTPKRILNLVSEYGMLMPDELLNDAQTAHLAICQIRQPAYAKSDLLRFLIDHEIGTFENGYLDFLSSQ